MRFGVLVSGRGTNLQAVLDAARAGALGEARIAVVVSDRPGALALERARAAGVATRVVDRKAHPGAAPFEAELLARLDEQGVEAVVLAGFMRLLSGGFLARFPGRVVNIHPSLLPAFPGMHGVRDALAYGVKVAGCTVHLVDEGTDTGPVILQAAVPVLPGDDEASLAARILVEEHRLLPEAIRLLASGRLVREGRAVRLSPA